MYEYLTIKFGYIILYKFTLYTWSMYEYFTPSTNYKLTCNQKRWRTGSNPLPPKTTTLITNHFVYQKHAIKSK